MELAIIIVLFVFIMLNSKIVEGKINFKKGFKKIGSGIKKVGKKIVHGLGKIANLINMVKYAKNDYKTIKSGCV